MTNHNLNSIVMKEVFHTANLFGFTKIAYEYKEKSILGYGIVFRSFVRLRVIA